MDKAFQSVSQLVAYFKANEQAYLLPSYQENQIREDVTHYFHS